MNLIYKLLIEAGIVLALVGGAAFAMHRHDSARIAAAEDANASLTQANVRLVAQRELDQATLTSLAAKRADLGRQSVRTHASLHAAAASAPDWASQPVPKEVQDALKP
jgi:hypothetical protein